MDRASRVVGPTFGLAVGLLIVLAGPLLLFNPWFVSTLQQRHHVAAAFETSQAEIDRITGQVLGDLFIGGSFEVDLDGQPLLDDAERAHMADVSRLVRVLVAVVLVAAIVAAMAGRRLRGESGRMAAILLVTSSAVGLAALTLAVGFAIAFEPAFLAFHAIVFPPGTYLFEPGSNLVTLFPEGFWFDASLTAGATVLLSALVVLLIGARGRRRPRTPLAAG